MSTSSKVGKMTYFTQGKVGETTKSSYLPWLIETDYNWLKSLSISVDKKHIVFLHPFINSFICFFIQKIREKKQNIKKLVFALIAHFVCDREYTFAFQRQKCNSKLRENVFRENAFALQYPKKRIIQLSPELPDAALSWTSWLKFFILMELHCQVHHS